MYIYSYSLFINQPTIKEKENNLKQKMKFFTGPLVISALLAVVTANGCMVCKSGGSVDHKVTKDCCAADGGSSSTVKYNDATHQCEDSLTFGKGVNQGAVTKCCGDRGTGADTC